MSSNKILVLDTILRNPKLKRKLEDAYNAPIGSTKRQIMKDTVRSIKSISDRKFNNVQDGQGGPATSNNGLDQRYSSYSDMLSNPYNQSTSVNVPKAAPANAFASSLSNNSLPSANNQFLQLDKNGHVVEEKKETPAFGTTNPTALTVGYNQNGLSQSTDADTGLNTPTGLKGLTSSSKPSTEGYVDENGRLITDPVLLMFAKEKAAKEDAAKRAANAKNVAGQVNGKTNGTIVKDENGKMYAKSADGKTTTYIANQAQLADYVFKKGYQDLSGATSGKVSAKDVTNTPVGQNGGTVYGPTNISSSSTTTTTTGQASPELYGDTLAINGGPLATYMNAMNSEKNRRLYFPNQSEDFYKNGSGNLSAMLGDLKNSLKEEFNIDKLEDQYNQSLMSQQNIVPDLTDYVKRRDTAIKDLDGLISKAEKENAYSSDAVHMGAQNDYIKNLYTLRDRQTLKYSDMINRAQQVADKNLTNITNKLNKANTDFRDQLATMTAVTTDQYNNMKALISEQWTQANDLDANRVAKKELAAKELALDEATVNRALGIDATGTTSGGLLTLAEAKSFRDLNLDNEENLKPGRDITTILGDYDSMLNAKDGSPISGQYPVQVIKAGITNGLNAKVKDANGDMVTDDVKSLQNLNEYLQQFENNKQKLDSISPAPGTKNSNIGIFREQTADVILDGAQRIVDKYAPNNTEALKSATTSLKNVNVTDQASLAAWKKANSSIPSAILNGLAQAKADLKTDFNDYFGLNKTGGLLGMGGADSFDKVIADRIMYGLKASVNR